MGKFFEGLGNILKKLLRMLPLDGIINPQPTVAVLRLNGVIGSMPGYRSGLSIAALNDSITKTFKTDDLEAVAVIINSPGGSPVQSSLIAARLRQEAAKKNVKLYTFAEDVAASGGYWLLAAGDEAYANECSIIGSIGVISASFGFPEFIEKHGIERRVYTEGRSKSILDPFLPEKKEDIAKLKSVQSAIFDSFKSYITSRRGEKLSTATEIFTGEFWAGKKALELGLIDGIREYQEFFREKLGEKVKFKDISTEKGGLLKKLLPWGSSFGSSALTPNLLDAKNISEAVDTYTNWKRFELN